MQAASPALWEQARAAELQQHPAYTHPWLKAWPCQATSLTQGSSPALHKAGAAYMEFGIALQPVPPPGGTPEARGQAAPCPRSQAPRSRRSGAAGSSQVPGSCPLPRGTEEPNCTFCPGAKCTGTAQPPARKRRLIHYLLFPALIISVKLRCSVAVPAPVTWLVGHSSTLAEFLADNKEGSRPSVS